MLPPNNFGNLDSNMVYGMSMDLSINENQSWNPLDMLKQKEHLLSKQVKIHEEKHEKEMENQGELAFKSPIPKQLVTEERKPKFKEIFEKEPETNPSQTKKEFWDLMTLVDQETISK